MKIAFSSPSMILNISSGLSTATAFSSIPECALTLSTPYLTSIFGLKTFIFFLPSLYISTNDRSSVVFPEYIGPTMSVSFPDNTIPPRIHLYGSYFTRKAPRWGLFSCLFFPRVRNSQGTWSAYPLSEILTQREQYHGYQRDEVR